MKQETKDKIAATLRGRNHTKEHRENNSKSHKGRKFTEETKLKIGLGNKGKKRTLKQRIANSKIRLGTKHTAKVKLKISKSMKGKVHSIEHNLSVSRSLKGRKLSSEHTLKLSEITTKRLTQGNFNKNFKYKDTLMRSSYELKVATWLDKNNIKWEYESEKCIHILKSGRRYIIDFYLPELKIFIEVKGWWDNYSKEKFTEASKTKDIRIIDSKNIENITLERKVL